MSRSSFVKIDFAIYHQKVLQNIDIILTNLGIDFDHYNDDTIYLRCPIHNSEDTRHASISLSKECFSCWSGGCHEKHGMNRSILSFIRGVLSIGQSDLVSWKKTIDFIDNNGGGFHFEYKKFLKKKASEIKFFDEDTIPYDMVVPSRYYQGRGFSKNTLIKWDVGDSMWWQRAIIPVKYHNNKYMGFTSRSVYEKCERCNYYHSNYTECINSKNKEIFKFIKWYNQKGMSKDFVLYNIDNVITSNSNKVAIVEGPSCVWKLDDYNINACAALGSEFNDKQKELLLYCNIKNILLIADNDEKGISFRNNFISKYKNDFSITLPKSGSDKKDPSSMSEKEITNCILNKWNQI